MLFEYDCINYRICFRFYLRVRRKWDRGKERENDNFSFFLYFGGFICKVIFEMLVVSIEYNM